MNNDRRKQIKESNKKIDFVIDILNQYKSEIELIQSDEEDSFDNLPESFQYGLKGDTIQDAIDEMEDVTERIDEIVEMLGSIKTNLLVL